MKVSPRGPQTHALVLIIKKRQERFAQFGFGRLGNDLGGSGTNRPIVVAKGFREQVARLLVFCPTQDKEHFGAVGQSGLYAGGVIGTVGNTRRGAVIRGPILSNSGILSVALNNASIIRGQIIIDAFLLLEKARSRFALPVINIHERRRSR